MGIQNIPLIFFFAWVLSTSTCFASLTHENMIIAPSRNNDQPRKRCGYTTAYRMRAADCRQLDLRHIPSSLKSNIEVLDVTDNKIRELHNTSFINYPSLRFLYLSDNSIYDIEAGALDPLPDLEVLDLTMNVLHYVPEAINSLPVLRKLMLGGNALREVTFTQTLPSIEFLSLSSNKLKSLPVLSALPGLVQLNMSNNNLKSIDIHKVAPMCRLKLLDLRKNNRLFQNEYCNCQLFTKWTESRSIELFPEPAELCKGLREGSTTIEDPATCFTNETQLLLEESERISRACETKVLEYGSGPLRLARSVVWTLAGLSICVVILVCVFSLYCIRKRQRNREETDNSSERLAPEKGGS